jgi:hypothetical protein
VNDRSQQVFIFWDRWSKKYHLPGRPLRPRHGGLGGASELPPLLCRGAAVSWPHLREVEWWRWTVLACWVGLGLSGAWVCQMLLGPSAVRLKKITATCNEVFAKKTNQPTKPNQTKSNQTKLDCARNFLLKLGQNGRKYLSLKQNTQCPPALRSNVRIHIQ